eukprot:2609195-Alexandrium_andersonii.AAC.1
MGGVSSPECGLGPRTACLPLWIRILNLGACDSEPWRFGRRVGRLRVQDKRPELGLSVEEGA